MTALDDLKAAGRSHPDWNDTLEAALDYIEDQAVNNPGSSLALDGVLSTHEQSSASNITLGSVANIEAIEMTTSGKSLTFPVTGTGNNLFDGLPIIVINTGSTNSFTVKTDSGTTITTVQPNSSKLISCLSDSSSDGTYSVVGFDLLSDTSPQLGGDLDCNGNGINMGDQVLSRPEIKDYSETLVTANSTTSYAVDLSTGNAFDITMTGNCTFTFTNPPSSGKHGSFVLYLTQDGTGSRTATWPASVKWATNGDAVATLSTGAADVDILTFTTKDGGTTWYGFTGGLDFA